MHGTDDDHSLDVVTPDDLSMAAGGEDEPEADRSDGTGGVVRSAGPVPLQSPRDGVPPVVATPETLQATVAAFAAGTGPVAVDAERASGHRYGQRAFLVQLRRAGAGTALIDPAALPDLSALGAALADAEWVLHAATQDLPCLAELGMRPHRLFDTELGSRLAGFSRVGLAAVVEQLLGLGLAKEHSAVDWSVRPLPAPWLRYAALDVEVLIELREVLAAELERQGKLAWALEEFQALVDAPPPAPRPDPWRRTSGVHRIRSRRQLAAVRELWTARDELARMQDVSPGRLLPDSAIVEVAIALPADARAMAAVPGFTGRGSRRFSSTWFAAITRARRLPDAELPPQHLPPDGPPPARVWSDRDPAAATRLAACRAEMNRIATEHDLPVENLLTPDSLRRLAWAPPAVIDSGTVTAALRGYGARDWQLELTVDALVTGLATTVTPG